jgi:hypothetical protein
MTYRFVSVVADNRAARRPRAAGVAVEQQPHSDEGVHFVGLAA